MTNLKPSESLERGIAVVHFRTMCNGAYRYMAGKRRGYYRVLVVRERARSYNISTHNVLDVLYIGPEGIDGVTEKSAYYLGASRAMAERIAQDYNVVRDWS